MSLRRYSTLFVDTMVLLMLLLMLPELRVLRVAIMISMSSMMTHHIMRSRKLPQWFLLPHTTPNAHSIWLRQPVMSHHAAEGSALLPPLICLVCGCQRDLMVINGSVANSASWASTR